MLYNNLDTAEDSFSSVFLYGKNLQILTMFISKFEIRTGKIVVISSAIEQWKENLPPEEHLWRQSAIKYL